MKLFNKEQTPLIQFISTVPGLADIEECQPKPTNKFIPEWWKNMPAHIEKGKPHIGLTAKSCPALPDYFSQGYVIPMWVDTILQYDKESNVLQWKTGRSGNPFKWDYHPNEQFLNYVTPEVRGVEATVAFKAVCPWRIITPPGYSVFQMPLFYNFNQQFSVLPGVISTDVHHELNQQVLYYGNGEEIYIKRGEPFVQYIPFKRTKYDMTIRDADEKDSKLFEKQATNLLGKFRGSYSNLKH